MTKQNDRTRWIALGVAALLIVIDQLMKVWVYTALRFEESITVIPGLFSLTYVENRGAAFGIFQGRAGLLAVITGLFLVALLAALLTGYFQEKLMNWTLALIIAGGFGNLIDRVLRGYVVDFLDFSALFHFPVFNFADCCVVVGAILMIISILRVEFPKAKASHSSDKAEME